LLRDHGVSSPRHRECQEIVQSPVSEEIQAPVVNCLNYEAISDWHFGEIASFHALLDEAISTAKELKDRIGTH
jgi:hypothetical protein